MDFPKTGHKYTVITWAEDIMADNSPSPKTIFAIISEATRYTILFPTYQFQCMCICMTDTLHPYISHGHFFRKV